MKVSLINGSTNPNGANARLLKALPYLFREIRFTQLYPTTLPLFIENLNHSPLSQMVLDWRQSIAISDAIIISTPEYIHNIPAVLKNALEWLTTSGELSQKRVLPITFTPHPPRGEKAMQALTWSLQALNANIVAQLSLYQNELFFSDEGILRQNEDIELLSEALQLLID